MSEEHDEADKRMIGRSHEYMSKAIWSHLNLLLLKELSAAEIDRATELFITGGFEALSADWFPQPQYDKSEPTS